MGVLIALIFIITTAYAVEKERTTTHITVDRKPDGELHLIKSGSPVGYLNSMLIFLADQIEKNKDRKFLSEPVVITTFSNLDNLEETNSLGRLIAESLIHEFQVRKWRVLDIRLSKNIEVNSKGEFVLNRDVEKLYKRYRVAGVITGTYSITEECVFINARLIDVRTGVVLSSGQVCVPTYGIEELLFDRESAPAVRIVGGD
jgi:TolB-like protein